MQRQETVYSKFQLSKSGLHQGGAAVVRDVSSYRLLSCCLILAAGRTCAFEEKKKRKPNTRKPVAPKKHHEILNRPATVITSRRRATKRVPRVSPYSHESNISRVCGNWPRTALEISKKHECYTYTSVTDYLNNGTLTHTCVKSLFDRQTTASLLSLIHISEPTRPY